MNKIIEQKSTKKSKNLQINQDISLLHNSIVLFDNLLKQLCKLLFILHYWY